MRDPRDSHTATLLKDGRILVAGGLTVNGETLASAEILDTRRGIWTSAGSMTEPKSFHSATLLEDGRVVVVGGTSDGSTPHASVDVYDPTTNSWRDAGIIKDARWGHTAVLLITGQIQVIGGFGFSALSSVELYTPTEGGWASAERNARLRLPNRTDEMIAGRAVSPASPGPVPN